MTRVLLDFPWRIDATLDPDPAPLKVIRDFFLFLSHVPLMPTPFVDAQEQALFMEKLSNSGGRGRWVAEVFRFLAHVSENTIGGTYRANPVDGPADLRDLWLKALRAEMSNLADWRIPQILLCAERASEWAKCIRDGEILIALEDRAGEGPHSRVIVTMGSYRDKDAHRHAEDYRGHKYVVGDEDPWDLRHCKYNAQGTPDNRCLLPRPARLNKVALADLEGELASLRSESWPDQGRYWFIPPESWKFVMSKGEWRKGAFEERTAPNQRKGPIDYKEQIWYWHAQEGHWDVQLKDGTHKKIKPNGDPWK